MCGENSGPFDLEFTGDAALLIALSHLRHSTLTTPLPGTAALSPFETLTSAPR